MVHIPVQKQKQQTSKIRMGSQGDAKLVALLSVVASRAKLVDHSRAGGSSVRTRSSAQGPGSR